MVLLAVSFGPLDCVLLMLWRKDQKESILVWSSICIDEVMPVKHTNWSISNDHYYLDSIRYQCIISICCREQSGHRSFVYNRMLFEKTVRTRNPLYHIVVICLTRTKYCQRSACLVLSFSCLSPMSPLFAAPRFMTTPSIN